MSKPNIYDENFSERMKLIGETYFKGNYSEFARAVGVAQASLARWVKGEADPSRTNLIKIAEAANVSLEWLALGTQTISPKENETANQDSFLDDFELIPYYSIRASAGYGAFNDGSAEPSRYLAFTREWLNRKRLNVKDLVMISAVGDSMEPNIYDGDILLVDMSNKTPRDGRIYIIRVEDQLWVKRIQGIINGIRLISDNKDIYDPIDIKFDESVNCEIIGQVVHVGHDLMA